MLRQAILCALLLSLAPCLCSAKKRFASASMGTLAEDDESEVITRDVTRDDSDDTQQDDNDADAPVITDVASSVKSGNVVREADSQGSFSALWLLGLGGLLFAASRARVLPKSIDERMDSATKLLLEQPLVQQAVAAIGLHMPVQSSKLTQSLFSDADDIVELTGESSPEASLPLQSDIIAEASDDMAKAADSQVAGAPGQADSANMFTDMDPDPLQPSTLEPAPQLVDLGSSASNNGLEAQTLEEYNVL